MDRGWSAIENREPWSLGQARSPARVWSRYLKSLASFPCYGRRCFQRAYSYYVARARREHHNMEWFLATTRYGCRDTSIELVVYSLESVLAAARLRSHGASEPRILQP